MTVSSYPTMALQTVRNLWSAASSPASTFNTAFQADKTFNNLDGHKYYTWRAIRRQKIDQLTEEIMKITLYITLSAAMGFDQRDMMPDRQKQNSDAGRSGGYGIANRLGVWGWWIFSLVVLVILAALWFPVLQWFEIRSSSHRTNLTDTTESTAANATTAETTGFIFYVQAINKYAFLFLACTSLFEFVCHLYGTFLHVNAKPKMSSVANTLHVDVLRTRNVRLGLLAGIVSSASFGALAMYLWHEMGLMHVTTQEYAFIVVPIQITLGVTIVSIIHAILERPQKLPIERDLFEKDANEELTVEGLRQALSFLVKSDIDMKVLQDIGAGKYKDRKNSEPSKLADKTVEHETITSPPLKRTKLEEQQDYRGIPYS